MCIKCIYIMSPFFFFNFFTPRSVRPVKHGPFEHVQTFQTKQSNKGIQGERSWKGMKTQKSCQILLPMSPGSSARHMCPCLFTHFLMLSAPKPCAPVTPSYRLCLCSCRCSHLSCSVYLPLSLPLPLSLSLFASHHGEFTLLRSSS